MPTTHEDPARLFRSQRRRRHPDTAQTPRGTLVRRMQRHLPQRRVRAAYRGGRGVYVPAPGAAAQRVVVKTQVVRPRMSGHRSWKAALRHHLQYLERDGVALGGEAGHLYTRADDGRDPGGFLGRSTDDGHQFRVIVSPERGHELDLTTFTRDLMRQVAEDLGTQLDWVGVNHYDTDHPHTHVLLRGVDAEGQALYLAQHYLTEGLRARAQELATRELGWRLEPEPAHRLAPAQAPTRHRGIDMDMDR